MRRLHVIASVDPASGGPVEGLVQQEAALADLPPADVITLDAPDAPFLARFPLRTFALGARGSRVAGRRWERYGYSPALVPWLRANVHAYDAVIVHGLWNYAASGAGRVLPRAGVPYFVYAHGMMDPWFRRRAPLKHLGKQVSWLAAEGRLAAGARAVLFTTEEERRLARGSFRGGRYREAVVGFGVAVPPPARPEQAEAFAVVVPGLRGRDYLLLLGRVHEKKGIDLLIAGFAGIAARRPELDLVIAGAGDEALVSKLKQQAQRLGIGERVHWPGWLGGDAKWGALRGAQAMALISHQENFGVAVAEALGCGVPVLVSDRVNIWREIEAGGAGLVGPDTATGARWVLARWADLSEAGVVAMRQAAVRLFNDRYDVAKVAPATIETLRSLR